MARMHSRRKGKSSSKRPLKRVMPTWVRYSPKEVELLIQRTAKEDKTPSQIGILLRDNYGIPDVKLLTGKSVTKILAEKKILPEIPEDLMSLMKKNVKLVKHMEKNKQDQTAKRGLTLIDSKIKRLVKYYKKKGKLPSDWKYSPEKASMFIE